MKKQKATLAEHCDARHYCWIEGLADGQGAVFRRGGCNTSGGADLEGDGEGRCWSVIGWIDGWGYGCGGAEAGGSGWGFGRSYGNGF